MSKAQELASRAYATIVFRDVTTDGDDYVYIAINPEFDGCVAQGLTMEEARTNLNEVRVDLIEHLLEYDLHVPNPQVDEGFTNAKLFMGEPYSQPIEAGFIDESLSMVV